MNTRLEQLQNVLIDNERIMDNQPPLYYNDLNAVVAVVHELGLVDKYEVVYRLELKDRIIKAMLDEVLK
jgi:hypothetical protein